MDLFKYIVENLESLSKFIFYIVVVPSIFFVGFIKRIYFNHRYKAPSRTIKLITYLTKYKKYLDDEDEAYIMMRINDEIMRDAANIPSQFNRKELIYIFNKIEKKSYINQLYKLQPYIEKINGCFHIETKFDIALLFSSRLLPFLMALFFFVFMTLGGVSIYQKETGNAYLIFLSIAMLAEFVGIWMFSTFPTQKTIAKINVELSKFRAPD